MLASLRAYLAGAILLVMAGLVASTLWYRSEAIQEAGKAAQARADLSTAIDANKAQEATIGRLRASAEATNRIMLGLADQLASINQSITDTNQQIGDIRDANPDVRDYLGTPVPADLRLLLDR